MKTKLITTIMIALFLASMLSMAFVAPVAATPDSGIVGLWHFDEGIGSTAQDSSGFNNHGTLSGGKFGNALYFDGADDYVEVAHSASMDVYDSYTFEAWICLESAGTSGVWVYRGFFRRGTLGVPASEIEIYTQPYTHPTLAGKLTVVHNRGGSFCYRYFTPFPLDQWVHLAVTWDGTTSKAYYNGIEQSSTGLVMGDSAVSDKPSFIGVGYYAAYMKGLIDEVRLSNITRTTFDLMVAPTVDANTVALWHFDESVGNKAYDETTNHNDGTICGATWAGPRWATGVFDGALAFDGVDDYVVVPDSSSLKPPTHVTVEAWWKADTWGPTPYPPIVKKASDGLGYALEGHYGKIAFWVSTGGTGWKGAISTDTLSLDTWYHTVGVYDGVAVRIYVNELEVGTTPATGTIDNAGTELQIGHDFANPTRYFDGIIDEVRIWNVAVPFNLQFDSSSTSIVKVGDTATLKVCLTDASDAPVDGVAITYSSPGLTFTPPSPQNTDPDGCVTFMTTATAADLYQVTAEATTPIGLVSDTWTLVVYDPAGMTAGGGWYLTEPDTDTCGIVPGARATFGFVVKYIKGSSTGNLEFQYHVEDKLNLKSTSITWLVVSGSNAQFKGTATLNGVSGYYFRVIAEDKGEPGVGKDTFAIKIWLGDSDNGGTLIHSSHNTLAGGNIMVRTK